MTTKPQLQEGSRENSDIEETDINFLGNLEGLWAWDVNYWNHIAARGFWHLEDERLDQTRISIIKKLERIDRILKDGVERSDDEIMLSKITFTEQLLLHPIKFLRVLGQRADTVALRSKNNLTGVRHNLRFLLVQLVETQIDRGIDTVGIPEHLDGDDIPGFKEHLAKRWQK